MQEDYNIKSNNCEHLTMIATCGHPLSVQVDRCLHKALQCSKHTIKPIGLALAVRAPSKGMMKVGFKAATVMHEVATKSVSKTGAKAVMKSSAKVAFKLGYKAALNGTTVGAVGGIAVGINLVVEGPLLARSIYKLHQRKQFDMISDEDYKRGVIKESFTSVNTVIGGAGGAVVGQIAIPVPVLGAAVGGVAGSLLGQAIGYGEGWLFSHLIHDKPQTIPPIITPNYTYIPDETELETVM